MTEQIKIENGIPIPEGRMANNHYPFGKLDVGQSFFLSEKDKGRRKMLQQYAAQANVRMKPKRFASRTNEEGIRFWRVA